LSARALRAARRCDGAIVIGASYRALAVVRSLGRHRIPVCVLQSDEHSIARHSRYSTHSFTWNEGGDRQRRERLLELVADYGMESWTVIATGDEDAALLAREHAALSGHVKLTVPPWEVLRNAYDKRAMHALADALGLAQPETRLRVDPATLAQLQLRFPAIVKPAYKVERNALTAAKAWRVDDAAELTRCFEAAARLVDPAALMVQELVPGDEQLSCAALCVGGELLASLTARRTRQFPLEFGKASTYVETIDDRSIVDDARRLLGAMRFSGIAEVEFKRDPDSGANKLLDVNPRAWGWQSLCDRAGVDFPLLLWLHANGHPLPQTLPRTGVRWVRMAFDLQAVARMLASHALSLHDYVQSLRGPLVFATFARDDPLPAVVGGPALLRVLVARLSSHAHA
jgi:predicted ATP-grasp superfamily ATP-dependent carboligase